MKPGDKTKLKILEAANTLFYHQGFNATSIGNIVSSTGLSKGNITYHFKSKQDILEGIINQRLVNINALLDDWNRNYKSPVERLCRFCEMLLIEKQNISHFGCPMGTLIGELSKNQPELQEISLTMLEHFKTWLEMQFIQLNFTKVHSKQLALELLSRVQGIAVITHSFKDDHFLITAINHLKAEVIDNYQQ